MDVAVPFYDKLLPLLGFDIRRRVDATIEEHDFRVVDYTHPRLGFAITSPRSASSRAVIRRARGLRIAVQASWSAVTLSVRGAGVS